MTAAGDVLVGADGTSSNVRKQYLPHAQIVDTGIVGAACRLPISCDRRRHLPDLIWVLISSRAVYGDADPKTVDGESISRLARC